MIHFMQQGMGEKVGPLDLVLVTFAIESAHEDSGWAGDCPLESGQAETPLGLGLHAFAFDDLWIDHDDQVFGAMSRRGVGHEDPA